MVQLWFVLGLASRTGLIAQDARRLGLSHSLTRVGLYRLGSGKRSRLAFRHAKEEYGVVWAREEVRVCSNDRILRSGNLGLRQFKRRMPETMEERDFFNETTESRTHTLTCPKCGQAADYKVTWVVRRKKAQLPRQADERDRARFAKAKSYMVRRDDKLACTNIRCRKPFEITTLQSLAFLMD